MQETLNILEFDKIRTILSNKTLTPGGKSKAAEIAPILDDSELILELDKLTEMTEIMKFEEPFPLERTDNIGIKLDKVSTEGSFLNPEELLQLLLFLDMCSRLKKYGSRKKEKYPRVCDILTRIEAHPSLEETINSAVDKSGEIKDSASRELRKIRIEKNTVRERILSKLEQIVKSRPQIGSRQDDIITMRDGRYVIPVADSSFSSDSGIVHDRSKSGATLFVEPIATIEQNNRLRRLQNDEQEEIEKILREIADRIREKAPELDTNYRLVCMVDFIHAKALLSLELDCNRPMIVSEARVKLASARHPLLLRQMENKKAVIPIDISLGGKYAALIVTGPNTGGKTVSLKTLGLLVVMARAGMHIPASEETEVGSIHKVFADIGDEQSIELSLSTFSSHLKRIINAVTNADDHTMVLMDEIGAGTDPKEGAALGEAVITHLMDAGALVLVTTHYSALKTLAEKYPLVENASLQFDQRTLQPTFRFLIGIPGSSYAIDIAKRLGMPNGIVQKAEGLVGTQERSLSSLIESLEERLRRTRKQERDLHKKKRAVDRTRFELKELQKDLDSRQEDIRKKELMNTEDLVVETRRQLEQLVKSIRESSADKEVVKEVHRELREIQERVKEEKKSVEEASSTPAEKLEIGDSVLVESIQAIGELLEFDEKVDTWKVRAGNITISVKSSLLTKRSTGDALPRIPSGVNYAPLEEELTTQISVRGMTVDEAISASSALPPTVRN